MWFKLFGQNDTEGPRRADLRYTTTRLSLWVVGLLYVVATLFAQPSYRSPSIIQQFPENPVTETKVGDLERRLSNLESNKFEDRMIRMETIIEQGAKTSESNAAWLRALLVPLGLLCMEAMFRLATALPLRKKS